MDAPQAPAKKPKGPHGGRRVRAGRVLGGKNKKTLRMEARALEEARQLLDDAKAGKIELAKDVLQRMMVLAEGATGVHRPNPEEVAAGAKEKGSWELFGAWFDRTVYCAKELAKYQSPTYRAVAVTVPVDQPAPLRPGDGSDATPVDGKVVAIKDAKVLQVTYQRMITAAGS